MAIKNRMKTEPIPVVRQNRTMRARDITTMKPGKIVPLAAWPLLRMDGCSGRLNVAFNMNETYEMLMNRFNVRVSVWFFPHVANERFERNPRMMERSFAGEPKTNDDGADVIPYFEQHAYPAIGSHEVYRALGLTAVPGTMVNTGYQEAYNQIVNFMRRQRSKSLPMRELDDGSLAPALWGESAFSDVVPDFDDAMIAGELPLTVVQAKMPVKGIGVQGNPYALPGAVRESGGSPGVVTYGTGWNTSNNTADQRNYIKAGADGWPEIYALLAENGIQASLANIDQARALVDWAKKREGYEGHLDAFDINALMQGIPVDDLEWLQPMLIDIQTIEIVQAKRMATDGASLEDGAANGGGKGSVGINVPVNPYGGVIMLMAEGLPEQLYERQADPYFMLSSTSELPNYMQDALNPVPVVKVINKEVDVSHSTPAGQFGWARRNWKWASWPTRVGGDLWAPNADAATTVARRMIYPTDVANPTLSAEFYMSTTLGMSPFMDQAKEPIIVGIGGDINVTGLTIVGEVHESEANYAEVRAAVPPLVNPKG